MEKSRVLFILYKKKKLRKGNEKFDGKCFKKNLWIYCKFLNMG